jgi:ferredoxin-NADP reductase/nitrite reductase/ring-hydroxylating ferredoxin subunit
MAKEEDGYEKVADRQDLQEGGLLKVESGGKSIVLTMIGGKAYAIDSVCSHEGGPLEEGSLNGYEIECPWHGSKFDVRTGEVKSPPADSPQSIYEVKVENNDILVRKKSKSEQQERGQQQQMKGQENRAEVPSGSKRTSAVYQLKLLEKQRVESTDVMSFKFSKQEEQQEEGVINKATNSNRTLDYTAGQFAFFDIGGVNNDPKGPIRHFTISSSPTENYIMITTRIRDSPYKQRLSSLQEGVEVKARGPEGKFVLHEDLFKPAIFLSGGIGVTPFRSMIKYATDRQLPLKIVMFDSNRDQPNILFKSEFDECLNKNKNLKMIYTITSEEEQTSSSRSWKGERGTINKTMLTKYLTTSELNNSIFYICGPPGMLKAIHNLLQDELHIPKERIKTEEFTGY